MIGAKSQSIALTAVLAGALFQSGLVGCAPAVAVSRCEEIPKFVGTPPETIKRLEEAIQQIRQKERRASRRKDGRRAGGLRDAADRIETALTLERSVLHPYPYPKKYRLER